MLSCVNPLHRNSSYTGSRLPASRRNYLLTVPESPCAPTVVHCCATLAAPNLKLRESESCFLPDVDGTVTATGEGATFVATVG